MEKLSMKKKLSVVKEYLSGLSFDAIANKSGVSKGAVSGIIGDLKAGLFPEVGDLGDMAESLRELALDLKHVGLAPGQCVVGLAVLKRLGEFGLEPSDIERLCGILKLAGSEDKAKEFVAIVCRIRDFMEKTGLSLDKIDSKIAELEIKAAQLEPMLKQVDEVKHEISNLSKQKGEHTSELDDVKKEYTVLNPIVADLQKRQASLVKQINQEEAITDATQSALAMWNEERQKLAKSGFSLEELAEFNERVRVIAALHHIPAKTLRERLLHELETLGEGLKLEAKLQSLDAQLNQRKDEITAANKEAYATNKTVAKLKAEQAALEQTIKAIREAVGQEIAKVIPMARDAVSQFAAELKQGNLEALEEMRHLKEQALEVGGELGHFAGIVEANQWLTDLQSLAMGRNNLEPVKVRAVLLFILRGTQAWLKHHQANVKATLPPNLALVVAEVEQWRL